MLFLLLCRVSPCCSNCGGEWNTEWRVKFLFWFIGHYYWLEPAHAFETFRDFDVGLIALSFLQGSFAYGGWNFLNYVTEELVDPNRHVYPLNPSPFDIVRIKQYGARDIQKAELPPVTPIWAACKLYQSCLSSFRNLPRAIFISIPVVTFVYVFANVAYVTAMSPQELMASNAVAVVRKEIQI